MLSGRTAKGISDHMFKGLPGSKPRKQTISILVNYAVEELPESLRVTREFVLTRV